MKVTRTISALCLSVLAPAAALAQDAGKPQKATPPPPLPAKPLAFPAYTETRLANGAQVIIVENHEQPIATVWLVVEGGSSADPQGKAGVAGFTAALLDKGTTTRTAEQIAEAIDFVGGSLGANASSDWITVSTTALTEFLDTALVLLADVALNPTFPETELEIYRARALSSLELELSSPTALAQRHFLREVYGPHPYGQLETRESLRAIRRADLAAFHGAHFRPENALFVVAGDVRPADLVGRLNRHFGGWRAAPVVSRAAVPAAPERRAREIVLVHKPGAAQAVIRAGHLVEPAQHPDWTALDVALQVLGGGSSGWLFQVLREQKGYTYGAYASAGKRLERGFLVLTAEVRNEVADSALADLFALAEKIREAPVPAKDLQEAKDFMIGSFPIAIETPQQLASQVARVRLLGLRRDYLETYRERVAAVTAQDVQRVAREHLHPDRLLVVVVGDATKIRDKLARFGPVRVIDADGKPLSPEGPEQGGGTGVNNR